MPEFDQRSQRVEQQWNAGHDIIQAPPPPLSDSEIQKRRYRSRLLAKIEQRQNDFFENSLRGAALKQLGLSQQSKAVLPAGSLVLYLSSDQSEHLLPTGERVVDIYKKEEVEQRLLILGAPGVGKTTTLMELGCELLALAKEDDTQPIPVVFNLLEWDIKYSLADWLVHMLIHQRHVGGKVAQEWINTDRIALLLDGLDEVQKDRRSFCIRAINEFMRNHGIASVVICSRTMDYQLQPERVEIENTIVIQPLSTKQIYECLSRGRERMGAVRTLLHNDPALLEMSTAPLMLDILMLTYVGKSVRDIPEADIPRTRQEVFEKYIAEALQSRHTIANYTFQQTTRWLAWLASQLERHRQTEFYLEHMQPDWLEERQRCFYRIAARGCTALICALLGTLIGGLAFWLVNRLALSQPKELPFISKESSFVLYTELGFGLVGGLLAGFIHRIPGEIRPAEVVSWSWKDMRHSLVKTESLTAGMPGGLLVGLVTWLLLFLFKTPSSVAVTNGLVRGLAGGFVIGLISKTIRGLIDNTQNRLQQTPLNQTVKHSARNRIFVGLIGGLVVGLAFYLIFGPLNLEISQMEGGWELYILRIGPISGLFGAFLGALIIGFTHRVKKIFSPWIIVNWLRRDIWREIIKCESLKYVLVAGLSFGLVVGSFGQNYGSISGVEAFGQVLVWELAFGLLAGLMVGLIYELISGCCGGLSNTLLDERKRIKPNQGIQRSAQNCLIVWLMSSLFTIFLFGLLFWLLPVSALFSGITQLDNALFNGPIYGILVGLSIGLIFGGAAYIQHIVLRIFLWRSGCTPWNYLRFLEYANDRRLLTRIGGGYIFVHPLLRAYFASLEGTQPTPAKGKAPAQSAACVCGYPARPGARFCPSCGRPVQSS